MTATPGKEEASTPTKAKFIQDQSYRDLLMLLVEAGSWRTCCCCCWEAAAEEKLLLQQKTNCWWTSPAPAWAAGGEPLTSASADLRSTPAALELPCNLLLSMDRAPSPADSPLPLPPFCNLQHLEPEENDYSLHSVVLLLPATTLMIFIKRDTVSRASVTSKSSLYSAQQGCCL